MKTKIIRYLPGFVMVVLILLMVGIDRASSRGLEAPAVAPSDFCLTMIEAGVHHVGDTRVPEWEVPNAEGQVWAKAFNTPVYDAVVIRFETFEAGQTKVRVNGQVVLDIPDESPTWKFHAVLISREMLVQNGNQIRIEAGLNPGGGTDLDDFMFRNVGLVSCYSTIEFEPHHLGNTPAPHWLIPNPESVATTISFPLSESLPGTSILTMDVFDNTAPLDIKVNDIQVGTMQNGPETWKQQYVVVRGDLLDPQNNTLTLTPGPITGSDGPWDDVMFKNIRLYYETRSTQALYMPQIR